MDETIVKHVYSLIEKANQTKDGGDALKFSQAACNAANSIACLESVKIQIAEAAKRSSP